MVRVYNFAVEDDESYVTDCVLHNCEFYVNDERHRSKEVYAQAREERADKKTLDPTFTDAHLIVLAATPAGWKNLLAINHDSVTADGAYYYKPRTTHQYVLDHSDGLVVTTACIGSLFGKLALRGERARLRDLLGQFKDAMGERFFYEVQFNEMEEQKKVNDILRAECKLLGIEPVLTSDIHYACKGDDARQDEMIATSRRMRVDDPDGFKLTTRDLWYSGIKDAWLTAKARGYAVDKMFIARAAANTATVAAMCDADIYPDTALKPPPYVDERGQRPADPFAFLTSLAVDGYRRLVKGQVADEATYAARLKRELKVIRDCAMTDFFLVTWDIVRECKARGIMVWTRGSGCASLVAACMGITPLDPIRFGLLFERFVDPARPNAPDFDLDIDTSRRYEVIQWLEKKYGGADGDRIARVGAVQTFGIKAALREVLKSRGVDARTCNKLAEATDAMEPAVGFPVPQAEVELSNMKVGDRCGVLSKVIAELTEACDPETRQWIGTNGDTLAGALTMVGRAKGRGMHAAGYVVSPVPLRELVPVDRALEPHSNRPIIVTSWSEGQNSQDLADTGLMKVDMLGLETVCVVSMIATKASERHGRDVHAEINAWKMDFADPATLREFATGNGHGLHQLGASDQSLAQFAAKIRSKRVEDIIAAVAMFRPGSMSHLEEYLARARGEAAVPEVEPTLDRITTETYGVLAYQEQIMLALHTLGGIPLRDAYKLIKAISKKKGDEIKAAEEKFLKHAAGTCGPEVARAVFDDVLAFAGYGFNKAHAASYGVLSWITAYLRAKYPIEFWWAWLCRTDNKPAAHADERKVEAMMRRAQQSGVALIPPTVGVSGGQWGITKQGRLLAPLSLISGVGEGAAEAILSASRAEKWKDVWQFLAWIEKNGRVATSKVAEALAKAGALRRLAPTCLAVDACKAFAVSKSRKSESRAESARRLVTQHPGEFALTRPDEATYAVFERQALGFAFWRNPWTLAGRSGKVERLIAENRIADDDERNLLGKRRAFLVAGLRKHKDRKQREMAFLNLVDRKGNATKGVVFASAWERIGDGVRVDKVYLVKGEFDRKGGYLIEAMADLDHVER